MIYNNPASSWRFNAADVFAICIRDTIPSCILAPPEHVKMMIGNLICVARSTARVIFSPTTSPMLPIMKSAPMTAITTSFPRIFPFPVMTASSRFVTERWRSNLFLYPGKFSGSLVSIFASHSSKVSLSNTMAILVFGRILK